MDAEAYAKAFADRIMTLLAEKDVRIKELEADLREAIRTGEELVPQAHLARALLKPLTEQTLPEEGVLDALVRIIAAAEKAEWAEGKFDMIAHQRDEALNERDRLRAKLESWVGERRLRLDSLLASEKVPEDFAEMLLALRRSGHWNAENAAAQSWRWFRAQFAQPTPPEPEDEVKPPTAEEVYGILHPSHPINGGPGFDAEGRPLAPDTEPLNVGGEQISPGVTGPEADHVA